MRLRSQRLMNQKAQGLALLATSFNDEKKRATAMSKAFAGISVGQAGGYMLGSFMFQYGGIECPFYVIAAINVLDAALRLAIIDRESTQPMVIEWKYVMKLLTDKLILAGLAMNIIQNLVIGIFLGIGPAWMVYQLGGEQWIVGVILSVSAVVQVTCQFITGAISVKSGQWIWITTGFVVVATGMAMYPVSSSIWMVMLPDCVSQAGHGMLLACISPGLCPIVGGILMEFYLFCHSITVPLTKDEKAATASPRWTSLRLKFCRRQASRSPNLVVLIFFLTVMIDCMLMTVVDPILPPLMIEIDKMPEQLVSADLLTKAYSLNLSSQVDTQLNKKYASQISLLVGIKPGLEIMFNIAVGFLVDRYGHQYPMLIGCLFNLLATVGFAYMRNFYLLMLTRVIQALGSSLSVVGGLALLASTFQDEVERSIVMSRAFSGVAVGVAGGFALGSILFQFCGIECPFYVIAAINVLDAVLRLAIIDRESTQPMVVERNYVLKLVTDKLILAGLGITLIQNLALGIFLGIGPAWMVYQLGGEQWIVGVILSVSAVVQVLVQSLAGCISITVGQWKVMMIGMVILASGMALYPVCSPIWMVMLPESVTRVGHGMLMACISPILCKIADLRHDSKYGLVNGLYTATYNLGLFIGPNVGGILIKYFSFSHIYWAAAGCVAVSSLITLALRNFKHDGKLPNQIDTEDHTNVKEHLLKA